MKRDLLSPEEREEYDALMCDAGMIGDERLPSSEIGERLHDLLVDAVRAGRSWAGYVIDADTNAGHLARWKRWDKAHNRVMVSHEGRIVSRPGVYSVTRLTDEGESFFQPALFEQMTWGELRDLLTSTQSRINSDQITASTIRHLLELALMAPGSEGPADACALLGIDLTDFLADEATA